MRHYKQQRADFVNLRMKYVPNEMPFIHLMNEAEEVQESHNVTDWSADEIIAFIGARLDQSTPLAFVGDEKGFMEKVIQEPLARYAADLKAGKRYAIINAACGGMILVFLVFGVVIFMAPDNEMTVAKMGKELAEREKTQKANKNE